MSASAIVETLAKEFSVDRDRVERVVDLLTAGYRVPTVARYRRSEVGVVTDGTLRRFARRLRQLQELEKRRASLLRSIEELRKKSGAEPSASGSGERDDLAALRSCTDRFELEDLFLPHRRPEPEVQLALDRGLGRLADLLVEPGEREPAPEAEAEAKPQPPAPETEDAPTAAPGGETPAAVEPAVEPAAEPVEAAAEKPAEDAAEEPAEKPAEDAAEKPAEDAAEKPAGKKKKKAKKDAKAESDASQPYVHATHVDVSPQLARLCAPFVNPDRGVHDEAAALDGAMRILSDRLGRDPALRGSLRRMMRKHGRLSVRALVDEKKLGPHRSLLRLNTALRQIQGHRLLALRQAQAQRLIATSITIEEPLVLAKVRAALGKRLRPEYESVADVVAEQALRQRLLPMIEDDVRNELRGKAEEEAIRFLAQHLRQILLVPPVGARPVAGVHVDAKGDWVIVVVDAEGTPTAPEIKVEASGKDEAALAETLREMLRSNGLRAIAIGHGRAARAVVHTLRRVIRLLGADAHVFLVNEAGVAGYANSELARRELADWSVPARQAISIARRLQDPLLELLKCDLHHLGLGREQSVVSKANLRRVLHDTVESCVAFVGCELNRAPVSLLRHVPGLNYEQAKKLVERRAERPFTSREELRTESLLDDLSWTNAIGFLRVAASNEPLDRTAIHPEQYDLARRLILEGGSSVEEALGRRDPLRGLDREAFGVDEPSWRDLAREISHPGHDPRPRVFPPQLLDPDADPKELEKGRVVEGIVSNVASFGVFVDLGIPRDGMIHISEISSRYVRDARVLLAIGQVVRARVLDASGQRVELSLKNVPAMRPPSAERKRKAQRSRKDRRKEGEEVFSEDRPVMRAARSRRDGLVTGGAARERRRGGPPGNRRGGGRRRPTDEGYDSKAIREASAAATTYNPFATFFKGKKESGGARDGADEETQAR